MSYPQDCASCAIGEHDRHDAAHGLKTRLIGGAVCECKGDCSERWQRALSRIVEMLADPGEFTIAPPTAKPPANPIEDLRRAIGMIRDSRPTIIVDASDYEAVLAAAEGKPINVGRSPYAQPGQALLLASVDEVWRSVAAGQSGSPE